MLLVPPTLPHSYYAGGDANISCTNVRDPMTDSIRFCEDAGLWPSKTSSTKLLVSCDKGRLEWNTVMGPLNDPTPKGDIWVYDFSHEHHHRNPRRLRLDGFPSTSDFHPLGVDVLPATATEPAHVFIVNHQRNFSTIEQFILHENPHGAPYHAEYVRTWKNKAIHAPNGVAPLSPTSFYLSNDHHFTRRLPDPWGKFVPLIETILVIPGGWVDRLEWVGGASGEEIKITREISRVPFANGMALSPNGLEVAVVATTEAAVRLYDRNPETNALTYRESVFVPFSPDNVSYDEEKRTIIVAGHPFFPKLVMVKAKKAKTAPSWVVELSSIKEGAPEPTDSLAPYSAYLRAPRKGYELKTLYQSNGAHFSSSATGIQHDDYLFIAGLYADGFLQCKPN